MIFKFYLRVESPLAEGELERLVLLFGGQIFRRKAISNLPKGIASKFWKSPETVVKSEDISDAVKGALSSLLEGDSPIFTGAMTVQIVAEYKKMDAPQGYFLDWETIALAAKLRASIDFDAVPDLRSHT